MSTQDKINQTQLRSNSVTIKKYLNNIESINKDIDSVKSLTSTQSKKFRDILTKDKNKLIVEIKKVHLKYKHMFIKKMKEKSTDVMNAKLRILRSDRTKKEKDSAILQLNMNLDMFLLNTVREAHNHPFVKLYPEFIREINEVRMKLSPKSPLKRTTTVRRSRGERARGKCSLKKESKKNKKMSKKKAKNNNKNKKEKLIS